jgi:CheY-like chemotaxis protein
MDGEIGVDSLPSIGSLFWFEIAFALGDAATAAAPRARTRLMPVSLPPLRILVAEDALLNRELIAETLARHGHTVVLAEDGAGAAAAAEHAPPFDVVLMDIQMPGMNGEEAARRIRQLPGPAGSMPIIALTANVVLSDRDRYIAAGMDACLPKPIAWTGLFGTISRCLHDRGRVSDGEVGEIGNDSMAAPPAAGRLDRAATGVLAHRLAGMAAIFGLAAVARTATTIEAQAAQGHLGLLELTDDLARAVDATRDVLAGRPWLAPTLPLQAGTGPA